MWNHGCFFWNELNTRDADRARAFYGETLGWTFEPMPMPDGLYWLALSDGRPVAGLFTMNGPEFEGIPDHWFSYIAVDDVDGRIDSVAAAGGRVLRAPWDVPGIGRIAIVRDKNGAALGWMTPAAGGAAEGVEPERRDEERYPLGAEGEPYGPVGPGREPARPH